MKIYILHYPALSLLAVLMVVAFAAPDTAAQDIRWQVISSGGTNGAVSADYRLSGTVAQTAADFGYSSDYGLSHGFWVAFGEAECCEVAGDATHDGAVNLLDILYIINWMYKGGPAPVCHDEADADGNGAVGILDVTRLINYLYKGGPAPICGTTGT